MRYFCIAFMLCAAGLNVHATGSCEDGSVNVFTQRFERVLKFQPPAEFPEALKEIADELESRPSEAPWTEEELRPLGLILKKISDLSNRKLELQGRDLLITTLALSMKLQVGLTPIFISHWRTFAEKIAGIPVPGHSAHRAHLYGSLVNLEVMRSLNERNPEQALFMAFRFLGRAWELDFEMSFHPATHVIRAAIERDAPATKVLDPHMAELIGLMTEWTVVRQNNLQAERFSTSFLSLIAQVQELAAEPNLEKYPRTKTAVGKFLSAMNAGGAAKN